MEDPLETYWTNKLDGVLPLAHDLRKQFSERWVRFHTLPDSKRYPDTGSEYDIILDRHNTIFADIFAANAGLTLVSTYYSDATTLTKNNAKLSERDPHSTLWKSIAYEDLGDDGFNEVNWHLYRSSWTWRKGVFDEILRLVVDEETDNLMIVDTKTSCLLHPYDGGLDIIASSKGERDRLRGLHTDWLSTHKSGL